MGKMRIFFEILALPALTSADQFTQNSTIHHS